MKSVSGIRATACTNRFLRSSDVGGGLETAFIHFVNTRDAPQFSSHIFASTLQLVFDLGQLDDSRYMMSSGQSGHFRSAHCDDLIQRWERGERIRIPTRRSAIEARERLVLVPEGAN